METQLFVLTLKQYLLPMIPMVPKFHALRRVNSNEPWIDRAMPRSLVSRCTQVMPTIPTYSQRSETDRDGARVRSLSEAPS